MLVRIATILGTEDPLAETEIVDADVTAGAAGRARRARVASPVSARALPGSAPALGRFDAGVKRALDVVLAGIAFVAVSPLLAVLALLVKLDSRGPALFPQTRVGLGGRTFRMLKLRTMRDGAEHELTAVAELNRHDPRLFKIPADPRVTRLGRVIRRWSLDELPQLYNVLAGDMSLVGPRPFFESDLADYEAHHFRRLAVKPGLTGLWQVSGRSDIVDFEEVVRLDRYYIEHWSLALDARILARTVPAVVSRRGAY
ncbi:MAG: sugar transferase [Gemmatimonadaceae bacterium]